MAPRLDHVVIHVSDWERSGTEARHYRFGDQQLNVHGPDQDPSPVAARPAEPGGADLCFVWDGPIDAAVRHLEERGVAVDEGPVTRYGGRGCGTSVYFRDPDGSLLEFLSYE